MNPKVLIIILVILVVLFAVGIGVGATRGGGSPGDLKAAWVKSIGDALVIKQALTAADIDRALPAACRQQFEQKIFKMEVGEACILTVKGAAAPVRTLSLRLTQGTAAQVQVSQKDRMNVKVALSAGPTARSIDIYQDGGTLTLQCLPGGGAKPCQVTMGKQ
jgi:hypothetical protein